MTRFFNTAGPCKPEIHFVLPPMRRLPEVSELIERQSYFVLHAPRQSGKTTALLTLAAELTTAGRYAAALVSVEPGAPFGDDPGAAEAAILGTFRHDLRLIARDAARNLVIANPIYREVIPRELASVTADVMVLPARSWTLPDGRLDVDGLFESFVAFWRRHAEPMVRAQSYPEIAPHLVLMAYLQRVVNGGAMIEREYAAGSGRMDLCIRFPVSGGEQLVAIELKVWRDKQADPIHEGLAQLEGYLGRLGLTAGFLVIFDRRRAAEEVPWDERPRWENETLAGGKQVRVLRL